MVLMAHPSSFWRIWTGLRIGLLAPACAFGAGYCPEGHQDAVFEVNPTLILSHQITPGHEKPSVAFAKQAILSQLRYVQGTLNFSSGAKVAFHTDSVSIDRLGMKASPYPRTVEIDRIEGAFPEELRMPESLRFPFRVSKGSPATRITYRARIQGALCGKTDPSRTPALDLPLDPYLFYWEVPQASRRPIRWKHALETINPCADPEFSDTPLPKYFWYFWNPRQTGKDDTGIPFHCASFFRNAEYKSFPVKTVGLPAPSQSLPRLERLGKKASLSIAAIFGVIDPKDRRFSYSRFTDRISIVRGPVKPAVWEKLVSEAAATGDGDLDRGSLAFEKFLRAIPSLFEGPFEIRPGPSDEEKTVSITGRLSESKKPVLLKILFGPTDFLTPEKPVHIPFFEQSIEESDVVLYTGHSGLGENLIVGRPIRKSPDYQVFGIFSCHSFAYFRDQFVRFRSRLSPENLTDEIHLSQDAGSEQNALNTIRSIDQSILKNHSIWVDNREIPESSRWVIFRSEGGRF